MDEIPRSIFILLILLISSAFFAASETAFSYCNAVRIRLLAEDGNRRAKRVVKLLDSYEKTVITLLIAVNIAHVLTASIATVMCVALIGDMGSVVATIVTTVIVFLFCETIPKNIAKVNADWFAMFVSLPIMWFWVVFSPLSFLFQGIGNAAKKLMKIKNDEPAITEDELASMVEDVEDEGLIDSEETKIIKSAIEFGDLTAKDIMVPRELISAIPINAKNDTIKKIILEEKYTRFPVYDGNIDHIVGILQSSSYLWYTVNNKPFRMKNLLSRPYFVFEETSVGEIFENMGKMRTHITVVRSHEGTTVGIIAMEDILEEIVGEIYDEDDETSQGGNA